MSTLQITLPPFSPDYSGVASALFELGGMLILHDASGCTGNYLGYDEPRWAEHSTVVYCSGLRHLDAILGNDGKLVDRTVDAARKMHPRFIAVIGSPVPMLVGCDYDGLAKEIEARTGIPTFGFDATGLSFYDRGVVLACKALVDRYVEPAKEIIPRSVNLLGLTPFDFGARGNAEAIRAWFVCHGWRVLSSMSMGTSLEEIALIPRASLNVALSECGMEIARYLQKIFGTPYVAGCPIGDGTLMEARLEGKAFPIPKPKSGRKVVVFGEQILSAMLRDELRRRGVEGVRVDVLYRADSSCMEKGDWNTWSEKEIRAILASTDYTDVIADPLFRPLVRKEGARFHGLPSVAISSKVYWDTVPSYLGEEMDTFIGEVAG